MLRQLFTDHALGFGDLVGGEGDFPLYQKLPFAPYGDAVVSLHGQIYRRDIPMAEIFEIRIEAERLIHNDLENCAWGLRNAMHKKFDSKDRSGVGFEMMGSLIFSAFAIEAMVNYVGWKLLKNDWPERENLREKINLLIRNLALDLSWGQRPLLTISELKRFRDTIAHGKPEIINETKITDVRPEVFDALKGQWEKSVTPENVDRCCEDIDTFWKTLLVAAKIPADETLTRGGHSLTTLVTE